MARKEKPTAPKQAQEKGPLPLLWRLSKPPAGGFEEIHQDTQDAQKHSKERFHRVVLSCFTSTQSRYSSKHGGVSGGVSTLHSTGNPGASRQSALNVPPTLSPQPKREIASNKTKIRGIFRLHSPKHPAHFTTSCQKSQGVLVY